MTRQLDPYDWHQLDADGRARCKAWLARHGFQETDVYHYEEIRPGLFRISGFDRDAEGRIAAMNGEPVRWQRDVIDECPPPFRETP